MGWKAKIREIANRNWLIIIKNAISRLMIGAAFVVIVFFGMYILAESYDQPTEKVLYGLGIVSLLFVVVFFLCSGNIVEDSVISVFVLIMGCLLMDKKPVPLCLIPGCGAIVGTIIKGTIRATVGRDF